MTYCMHAGEFKLGKGWTLWPAIATRNCDGQTPIELACCREETRVQFERWLLRQYLRVRRAVEHVLTRGPPPPVRDAASSSSASLAGGVAAPLPPQRVENVLPIAPAPQQQQQEDLQVPIAAAHAAEQASAATAPTLLSGISGFQRAALRTTPSVPSSTAGGTSQQVHAAPPELAAMLGRIRAAVHSDKEEEEDDDGSDAVNNMWD